MNIMLASVTERTREIGIRRALGANQRDIIVQFLVETVMLSGAGGVLGVALGLVIPWFVSRFADMVTIVTFWSPMIAFSISALVGIIFGLYPAFKAAQMDPVEATSFPFPQALLPSPRVPWPQARLYPLCRQRVPRQLVARVPEGVCRDPRAGTRRDGCCAVPS